MTRELTEVELWAARWRCYGHPLVPDHPCPTCRADIVQLVDGTSLAPSDEQLANLRAENARLKALVDGVPVGEATRPDIAELRRSLDNAVNGAIDAHGDGIAALRLDRLIAALSAPQVLPTRAEVEQAVDRYGDARRSLEKCTDLAPAASWALAVKEARARILSLIPTREQEKHNDVG